MHWLLRNYAAYYVTANGVVRMPSQAEKTIANKEANMKEPGSKIPAEFWKTTAGQPLCNAMHSNAWEGLDCLNAQIDALTAASENTADATIKAELEKAKAKVISARAACRKAMAILSDSTF